MLIFSGKSKISVPGGLVENDGPKMYCSFRVVPSLSDKEAILDVKKILKGSLDSIPSPSPSVKIQIMEGKVCLR